MKTTKTTFTLFLTIVLSLVIYSCIKKKQIPDDSQKTLTAASNQVAKYDTVISLGQMTKDTVIWKVNNQYIIVAHEISTDEENEDIEKQDYKINNALVSGCSNTFAGSARATAKTTYATPTFVNYMSIASLRSSLQTDAYMHTRALTTSSPRITEENRNVSITVAYLYAISRESDNDYHMIIGDASHLPSTLLNCECGGLPASTKSSYNTIKAVRDYIKSYFGTDFCNKSGYTKFLTPIRITVLKGSLFFDIDHSAGSIGPTGLRANTSWEMHPIHDIHF